ncbi:NAD kinase [Mucilaginibacter sp. KACC 22063]|uniref:NAD kinase n=1 Tax=Mucilaginibacter sp. KACC 22063 TaxID=3025666 RepID=UPI002365EF96|nr:NAD kinase [Mucilaginibacter sp. KACC 22063]WDF56828.1 NAD kinase [Mucilaginibacter sp. KACC 22063]
MRIAVYGRPFNESVFPFARQVFEELQKNKVDIYVHQILNDFLSEQLPDFSFPTFDENRPLKDYIDVFLTLGGDGTLLDTVAIIRDSGIPVVGINFGRLGFLASINKDDIEEAVAAIAQGEFTLDSRSLIKISCNEQIFGANDFALNDITIHKRDDAAMITMHAYLDDEYLNSYWGDGMIISTSTGSTAYSMSCGGPIIFPQSDSIVVTPVSPHNLNVRPIVLPDTSVLTFEVETRSGNYLVSCDSRTAVVDKTIKFCVSKADFRINLIRLHNETYLKTLRSKLMWGIDARNY